MKLDKSRYKSLQSASTTFDSYPLVEKDLLLEGKLEDGTNLLLFFV